MEHPPQAPEEEGLEKAEQVGRIREALTRGEDEDSTSGRGGPANPRNSHCSLTSQQSNSLATHDHCHQFLSTTLCLPEYCSAAMGG
jgi:hypothetical protein